MLFKRVVKLVGHAAGQGAQGGEFFGLDHLLVVVP